MPLSAAAHNFTLESRHHAGLNSGKFSSGLGNRRRGRLGFLTLFVEILLFGVHLGSLDYPGRIWLSYFESRSSDFGRPVVPAIAGKSSFAGRFLWKLLLEYF